MINVLTNVSVIGMVALGQALAIISGGFDLSVGGAVPLGAVTFALFTNAGLGVPLPSSPSSRSAPWSASPTA